MRCDHVLSQLDDIHENFITKNASKLQMPDLMASTHVIEEKDQIRGLIGVNNWTIWTFYVMFVLRHLMLFVMIQELYQ